MKRTVLHRTTIETPSGAVVLVRRAGKLVALVYEDRWTGMQRELEKRFGALLLEQDPDGGAPAEAFRRYLGGDLAALDGLETDTAGTPFQEKVWKALRRIPAGRTISYADLARAIGSPAAVRAVAGANARNPVSIVVPCHRVIASDGALSGYGGGVPRKRWLLVHEGAWLA
ncbi:MAG TPA: methylated-DNA--[protein]-cysteine S-methyltransferase [Thermoanaerobaculia bacterium]|nr:methylated-DNA--[protein]-cysteine S-methyltransferase [Thermoanaerobaculia bacterium]